MNGNGGWYFCVYRRARVWCRRLIALINPMLSGIGQRGCRPRPTNFAVDASGPCPARLSRVLNIRCAGDFESIAVGDPPLGPPDASTLYRFRPT